VAASAFTVFRETRERTISVVGEQFVKQFVEHV
jgi:hypothetical protein